LKNKSVDKVLNPEGTITKNKIRKIERIEQWEKDNYFSKTWDINKDITTTLLEIRGSSSHINHDPYKQVSTLVGSGNLEKAQRPM
jgi:hypothetical protein